MIAETEIQTRLDQIETEMDRLEDLLDRYMDTHAVVNLRMLDAESKALRWVIGK